MDFEFVRHDPVYDRMIFVLTLDRQKMKERILVGEEQEIRFRLQGDGEADVLCDVTRPLGSLLAEFEHDPDREWNLNGFPLLGKPCIQTAGASLPWNRKPGTSWQKNISPAIR